MPELTLSPQSGIYEFGYCFAAHVALTKHWYVRTLKDAPIYNLNALELELLSVVISSIVSKTAKTIFI
jgi:hypothetical protein